MEESDMEQYKALMEDVEEIKKNLKVSSETALLLMVYDRLLDIE
jgi:hypothetical protein